MVHTQNLDSFWALLKRGIIGTYHSVIRKYLPLYLNEFAFRHNNRHNDDIFGEAMAGVLRQNDWWLSRQKREDASAVLHNKS
jgi:hypothetical protein